MSRHAIVLPAALTSLLASKAIAVPSVDAQACPDLPDPGDVQRAQKPARASASPSSCLNYLPDGTQTYVAHVTNDGKPAAGVEVGWTDSDAKDAHFRIKQTPCVTSKSGTCQAEVDTNPKREKESSSPRLPAGSSANGYLTFK